MKKVIGVFLVAGILAVAAAAVVTALNGGGSDSTPTAKDALITYANRVATPGSVDTARCYKRTIQGQAVNICFVKFQGGRVDGACLGVVFTYEGKPLIKRDFLEAKPLNASTYCSS